MDIYFLGYIPVEEMKIIIIIMSEKRKKKCSRIGWATAQLCHNTMGNCIATQHVWACSRLLGVSQ